MTTDRYTIISSDCHAGANHQTYREYLTADYHEAFDAWRGKYRNPFRDLQDDGRTRNWDNTRRIGEQAADGVVAEVIFPNTVPPFFPTGQVVAPAPTNDDLPMRLAGLRAHNRWLVDFVADYPQGRAGLAQVFLNDVDEAIADVRWAKEHGLAGVLLPGVSPDTPWIDPLFSQKYDPLWAVCQELDMSITHHSGGSGIPNYGKHPVSSTMFVMEAGFFANRALWHLVLGGVFERFPRLKFALTEQGCAWIPATLQRMDDLHRQMVNGRIGEMGVPVEATLAMKPSEYFRRNCYVGASFPGPADAAVLREIGIERVMWGTDYPHHEGTYPYTREALRRSFADWSEADMRRILTGTAAEVYGFDPAALQPFAAQHGPTVAEIATPLQTIPADATSPAFSRS